MVSWPKVSFWPKTMDYSLSMKVIPILNGNDVVSPNPHMNADLQNVRPFVTQN